jgi:Ca2+/Na+ antiporter
MWIGLILIGLVTSMPEMVTGVSAAAIVGQPDLALGNFWGSCILTCPYWLFSICFTEKVLCFQPPVAGIFCRHFWVLH